jgi:hypothetical protein
MCKKSVRKFRAFCANLLSIVAARPWTIVNLRPKDPSMPFAARHLRLEKWRRVI